VTSHLNKNIANKTTKQVNKKTKSVLVISDPIPITTQNIREVHEVALPSDSRWLTENRS
jgi:uncharacterized membrane protein